MGDGLIEAKQSPRFARFFAGYARRMLARDFANVRLSMNSRTILSALGTHDGPSVVAMNHASWWDPLVGLVIARAFAPDKPLAAPIEAAQLEKFAFMRRLGLFGIDPDRRDALRTLVDHASALFAREPRTVLGLTPQGAFTDVRTPVRVRPGIGAIAARLGTSGTPPLVLTVGCEYVFWHDRKPELLIHALPCDPPAQTTTAAWTREVSSVMERARQELAALSIARDASAFEPLFGSTRSGIHPVYDLLLRLRGRTPEINASARGVGRTA